MIGSNAFNYVNVLKKAADASWKRNEVIANNIANVSTPGYKRKDIQFENYLRRELMKDYSTDDDLNRRVANVDLDRLGTRVYTDQSELSYRLDGNNVDTVTEMTNLIDATRSYEANVTAFNATKNMLLKGLDVGS